MNGLVIRRAEAADAPVLIALITALADFEHLPPPDPEAIDRFTEHGFGANPKYEAWLAIVTENDDPKSTLAVGYALFFETYSTFLLRPSLYLEDLFVLPDYRGRGIGKALLNHCIGLARERECGRMEWACLDWNTKAQAVYEGMGAKKMQEWLLYRLVREDFCLEP